MKEEGVFGPDKERASQAALEVEGGWWRERRVCAYECVYECFM